MRRKISGIFWKLIAAAWGVADHFKEPSLFQVDIPCSVSVVASALRAGSRTRPRAGSRTGSWAGSRAGSRATASPWMRSGPRRGSTSRPVIPIPQPGPTARRAAAGGSRSGSRSPPRNGTRSGSRPSPDSRIRWPRSRPAWMWPVFVPETSIAGYGR